MAKSTGEAHATGKRRHIRDLSDEARTDKDRSPRRSRSVEQQFKGEKWGAVMHVELERSAFLSLGTELQ
jgi:hypothetical protein